jgi:flagellin
VKGDVAASGLPAVVAAINGPSNTSAFYSSSYAAVRYVHDRIKAAGGSGVKDVLSYMSANPGATLDAALANAPAEPLPAPPMPRRSTRPMALPSSAALT